MAEGKQKKVDTGKALLDNYQKEKERQHKTHHGGDFYSSVGDAHTSSVYTNEKPKSAQEADRYSMNVATLHKKTGQFESLSHKIRELKETLSEKNERIETLQIQNQMLVKGHGDQPNIVEENDKVIKHLQSMVDARDTYIKQLSESLQSRSEELEQSIQAEKEATEKLKGLEQQIWTSSKQFEVKLSESYQETVEYKAKVELLTNQIKQYLDSIKSLKDSLEENNKKVLSQQFELEVRDKKLDEYKYSASEQIKQLMSQMETLNLDLSKKEKEVIKTNKEMESLHRNLKEKFGIELVTLKEELEKKYAEDVKKVEQLYDTLLLDHIRKSEEDFKAVDKCSKLEAQMSTCKLSYEEEVNTYKDELKKILLKNKANEEQLLRDLENCKQEADHYRQQVENVENKLAEEVQKIKEECYSELNKYSVEMNAQFTCDQEKIQRYQMEIDSLSVYLREYALNEAKTEIEVESYQEELKKSAINISNILISLDVSKKAHEDLSARFSQLEIELQMYKESNVSLQTSLQQSQRNEQQLIYDLKSTTEKLREYEQQFCEYSEKTKYDAEQFGEKYNRAVFSFQEQIQRLMSELERIKAVYEEEILHLTSQTKEQENEINNLEAKLSCLVETNRQTDEANSLETCIKDLSYEQNEQLNIFRQLGSVNKMQVSTKGFLINVLHSLKEVKSNIETILYPGAGKEPAGSECSQSENKYENLDNKALLMELEKIVFEVMNLTIGNASNNTWKEQMSPNMITSTPHAKNDQSNGYLHETSGDSTSSGNINEWMEKCGKLESENKQLTESLFLLRKNLKDMEYCLLLATEESKSFNEKCKSLDNKITELEQSKLSEHLLKKENEDLKNQLIQMAENELKIHKELEIAHEKYTKLEQMYNRNITDLRGKVAESEHNPELEQIFTELKEKSDEVMYLKSQLETLQKSETELKRKALDAQSKYANVTAKFEHLSSELTKKKIELQDRCQRENRLSTENCMLQARLKSMQGKHSEEQIQIDTNSNCLGPKHNCGQPNTHNKILGPSLVDLDDLSQSRRVTLQWMASTQNVVSHTYMNKASTSNLSLEEKIRQELLSIDQDLADQEKYPMMPTIPEEDCEEERTTVQGMKLNKVSH